MIDIVYIYINTVDLRLRPAIKTKNPSGSKNILGRDRNAFKSNENY